MTEKIGSFRTLFMRFGKNQPVFCGIGTNLSEINGKNGVRLENNIDYEMVVRNGYIGDVEQL